jgi:hypothetical protein
VAIISIATELRSLRTRLFKTGKEAELHEQGKGSARELGDVSVPLFTDGCRVGGSCLKIPVLAWPFDTIESIDLQQLYSRSISLHDLT